jgi:hypothetical protein
VADAAYYGNGQKIACVKCKNINGHLDDDGFCAFANNMKTDEEISGTQVKQLMSALLDHGCKSKHYLPYVDRNRDLTSWQSVAACQSIREIMSTLDS